MLQWWLRHTGTVWGLSLLLAVASLMPIAIGTLGILAIARLLSHFLNDLWSMEYWYYHCTTLIYLVKNPSSEQSQLMLQHKF